jgi:hypothetical protein
MIAGPSTHREEISMESDTKDLLEQLTVVEAIELSIGNAFHAFRFSAAAPAGSAEQRAESACEAAP